ncbi:hypothetical protein RE628_21620 [Paenibacillus sp. D2_2]|uniref:hypothetical protein n=1 Tax=Paenibacillus sp. D2_2 TaxID=3073092 RepID=UPI0028167698|nr:hypothetical protein [Paenibacillus sp. D2_2]WMT39920.1 hypothetical protein RE628_21620 [Paenibacillus sp. D2_2]
MAGCLQPSSVASASAAASIQPQQITEQRWDHGPTAVCVALMNTTLASYAEITIDTHAAAHHTTL